MLKDARSLISDGEKAFINVSGNSGMSTAGSGDVFNRYHGALVAQRMDNLTAASLGVFIHGLSGDIMASETGEYFLIASDLIEGLKFLTGDEKKGL